MAFTLSDRSRRLLFRVACEKAPPTSTSALSPVPTEWVRLVIAGPVAQAFLEKSYGLLGPPCRFRRAPILARQGVETVQVYEHSRACRWPARQLPRPTQAPCLAHW
jgi:hypothetical protein